jgi:hypothetical protein
MEFSQKTIDTVSELYKFSGSKIKNPEEISALIHLTEKSQKDKLFYDIQFTAKYLNGLGKIMQSGTIKTSKGEEGKPPQSPEEAKEKIMAEYRQNILRFTSYLKDLLLDADEKTKTGFEEKFLSLSRKSLINLTTLIYDLSWLKKFYNSKRI